ncbi:MAG TPA: LON peptidase substrate-binding domain-containing protein [Candidatus Thermoplasmatota archaeon]|jgi:hypothetical protein|nr:LON peptidase substrate-binding domain-containing protein [Candidatus Thermoplasmatota archaeon]
MDRIPLFPLDVVLFPGMPLPLRIFEPRYHAMLRDCEARGQGFGVVLIREGVEVGGDAEPFPIGTLARIDQRSDHGDVAFIVARGTRRFRIARTIRERPYLEGEVAWLPEPEAGDPLHGAEAGHGHQHLPVELEVAALFEEYLRLLAQLTQVEVDAEIRGLLEGQRRASPWAVACAIGGAMLVAPEEKQPILEAASVHDALHHEQALLARETARLRVLVRSVDARLN